MKCRLAGMAILCGCCASLHAETVWQKDIPDGFQHQKWGAKTDPDPPAGLQAIAGAADPGGDILAWVNHANGGRALLGWEVSGVWNPAAFAQGSPFFGRQSAIGMFSGWCSLTTYTNQLYHFKQKGIDAIGDVANADDLHKELRKLVADWLVVTTGPSGFTKDLNAVFKRRNLDPTKARDGLTAQSYKQVGADVMFRSAANVEKKLPKSTLFEHLPTAMKNFGDTVSLRVGYDGSPGAGDPQAALWWRGPSVTGNGAETGAFHSMAVAGYDTAGNGTIWFADPDSNPTDNGATGNKDGDAGWAEASVGRLDAGASDTWLAAAGNGSPAKQRRFAAGAGVPKPADDTPTAAERAKLYFEGTLKASKTEFEIAGADYDRYDKVKIRYLETIEVVKAGKKANVPGLGVGPLTFQVSPGQPATGPQGIPGRIDEIFLFPASSAERITSIAGVRVNDVTQPAVVVTNRDQRDPGVWNVYFYGPGSLDRWGNGVPWGGVSLRAGSGIAPLAGLDLLEFDYTTAGGAELTAWDFFYNDSTDLTQQSLGVQVLGGGYDLPMLQNPGQVEADGDGDGAPNIVDNCPNLVNDQGDADADGVGDECEPIDRPALSATGATVLFLLLLLSMTWAIRRGFA